MEIGPGEHEALKQGQKEGYGFISPYRMALRGSSKALQGGIPNLFPFTHNRIYFLTPLGVSSGFPWKHFLRLACGPPGLGLGLREFRVPFGQEFFPL